MSKYEARAAAAEIWGATCAGLSDKWVALEKAVMDARRRRKPQLAEAAAAEAFKICRHCPAKPRCRTWAAKDGYSGLAAGALYHQGKRVPVSTPRPQAPVAGRSEPQ